MDELQLELAKVMFECGCPLSMLENKYWMEFFNKLSPTFQLPTQEMLSNSLLEKVYEETSTIAKEHIESAPKVAILCDGWSNLRDKGVINFSVTTPKPIFWNSIITTAGAETHTGEYVTKVIKEILEEIGPKKVLGICTDNAPHMKKARQLIQNEFPHIQTYGCVAHTLHLMFGDITKMKSVETSLQECSEIVKAIKVSQKLVAIFKTHQMSQKTRQSLKLPVKTRWRSIIHCMENILLNKHALQALAIDEEAKKILDSFVEELILSEKFWEKTEGVLKLVKPLREAILAVEGDDICLSIVAKIFSELQEIFNKNLSTSPIIKSEEEEFKNMVQKRRKSLIQGIHLAANLLDPRYRGCHLTNEESVDAMEKIYQISKSFKITDGVDENMPNHILGELANYKLKKKLFAKPIVWNAVKHFKPSSWWSGIFRSSQLSQIAAPILNLPPTSAAVRRSFSKNDWLHFEKRDRLTTDKAAKLAFISHNLALNKEQDESCTREMNVNKKPKPGPSTTALGDPGPSAAMMEDDMDLIIEITTSD